MHERQWRKETADHQFSYYNSPHFPAAFHIARHAVRPAGRVGETWWLDIRNQLMHFRGWWEVAHGTKARHWEAVGLYLSDPFGVHSERQVKFSTCGMPMFVKSPTAVQ